LGYQDAFALNAMIKAVQTGDIAMAIHMGDIAYDLQADEGRVGDAFLQQLEPISTRIPYQVAPGNHEHEDLDTFHNYRERFYMPQWESTQNMYYTFTLGPITFVSISTEDYFDGLEVVFVGEQYSWLTSVLDSTLSNRDQFPWLFVYSHRPLYCSNDDPSGLNDCSWQSALLRNGFDVLGDYYYGLETLWYNYGVDIYFCGHEHSYERTWPVYQSKVCNGTAVPNQPYYEPLATVELVSGAAGNTEGLEPFTVGGDGPWSAFRTDQYGFGVLSVFNATHLFWEQFNANYQVIDEFWLVKTHHGPFNARKKKNFY